MGGKEWIEESAWGKASSIGDLSTKIISITADIELIPKNTTDEGGGRRGLFGWGKVLGGERVLVRTK